MQAFTTEFRQELASLMRWRRDVRHFRRDPVTDATLAPCLEAITLAPSVGLSEPWRIVRISSDTARASARENFKTANADALAGYTGDKAALYAGLKLSGMQDAPVQLALFCDENTAKGSGLGAATMPETRRYSVVAAVMNFWLAARAAGLGVGWVSILDPVKLKNDLDVPENWSLVAYLCVGWPVENSDIPELETARWESRDAHLADMLDR